MMSAADDAGADELWTIERAARYLQVSDSWLYKAVAAQRVPHHRLGRSIRFRRAELDAWLAAQVSHPLKN